MIDWDRLIEEVKAAREMTYTPYSHFPVGAALLGASGKIYRGVNIENASYPLTICAERVALFSAYSMGERGFLALAIVTNAPTFSSPCGACRQVLVELAPGMPILLANLAGERMLTDSSSLLPFPFTPESLLGQPGNVS